MQLTLEIYAQMVTEEQSEALNTMIADMDRKKQNNENPQNLFRVDFNWNVLERNL